MLSYINRAPIQDSRAIRRELAGSIVPKRGCLQIVLRAPVISLSTSSHKNWFARLLPPQNYRNPYCGESSEATVCGTSSLRKQNQ